MDSEQQDAWIQLTCNYKHWQDMQSKGKIKMKKKMDRNNQEYYDFDFSKYQYFYLYPQNHISFAHPQLQKQFIKQFIQQNVQDFSQKWLDAPDFLHPQKQAHQIIQTMKQYQFGDFLTEATKQFGQRITQLRIKKSLMIHEDRDQKSAIQLVESQIRSFVTKQIRFVQQGDLGQPYGKRLASIKSVFKTRKFDQISSTNISKAEFIVFIRLILSKQRLSYNMEKIGQQIEINFLKRGPQIMKKANAIKGQRINLIQTATEKKLAQMHQTITKKVWQKHPSHFQDYKNQKYLQNFIQQFNYPSIISNLTSNSPPQRQLLNIEKSYKQLKYVPFSQNELKKRAYEICSYYFGEQIMQQIYKNGSQYACYKMNNFFSIEIRIISQSFNYLSPVKEKDLMVMQQLMKRQLQTIFSSEVDKLLNLQSHQIVLLVDNGQLFEQNKGLGLWTRNTAVNKQAAFKQMLADLKFIDPTLKYLITLLENNSIELFRQQIRSYSEQVIKGSQKHFKHLRLYYQNVHTSEKMHLLRVLNAHIQQVPETQDPRIQLYLKALADSAQMDMNMLQAYYSLVMLKTMQYKNRILNIINAQNCLLYKAKNKVSFLKFKNDLPFQMNAQFLRRFTYANQESENPFDFVFGDRKRSENYPKMEKDYVQIIDENKHVVFVRRKGSQNQLLEGNKIVYAYSLKDLSSLIKKIQKFGSFLIQRRQNFLNQNALTHIVDKIQLINDLMAVEQKYQFTKLKLMMCHQQILDKSVSPQGIIASVQYLVSLKDQQFAFDTSQLCFFESYENQSRIFQVKAGILEQLIKMQLRIQLQQYEKNIQKILHSNTSTAFPQLSSIYFQEEMMMGEIQEQNHQDQVDDNKSSVSNFQLDHSLIGNHNKSFVESSAVSFTGNQYRLKTSFQQILKKGSINQVKLQNAKKQQMLNRKSKKLISDSVLGSYLIHNPQYCHSLHFVYKVTKKIDSLIQKECANRKQFQISFLESTRELIVSSKAVSIRQKQLFSQQYFQSTLNQIPKIIDKLKAHSLNINENYICLSPNLLQSILNSNSPDCTQIRGLYLSLNYISTAKLHYQSLLRQNAHKIIIEAFKQQVQKYSNGKVQELPVINQSKYIIEGPKSVTNTDYIQQFINNRTPYLLAIDAFNFYYKAVLCFDLSVFKFYKGLIRNFQQSIMCFQQIFDQVTIIDKYKCWCPTKRSNADFIALRQSPNLTNKIFIKKKIELLKNYRHQILKKDNIKQLVLLPKLSLQKIFVYKPNPLKTQTDIVKNSQLFKKQTLSILQRAYLIHLFAKQAESINQFNFTQIPIIMKSLKMIPYANKKCIFSNLPNLVFPEIFQIDSKRKLKQVTSTQKTKQLTQIKLRVSELQKIQTQFSQIKDDLSNWFQTNFTTKRFYELNKQENQYKKSCQPFLDRIKGTSYQLRKYTVSPPTIRMKYHRQYIKTLRFRHWIQLTLLIFGCSLDKKQLNMFRMILSDSLQQFDVFFEENIEHILKPTQLQKMLMLNKSNQVLKQFYQTYYSFIKLKKLYKIFLEEFNDKFQSEQANIYSFLPFYNVAHQQFQTYTHNQNYDFLLQFSQQRQIENQLQKVLKKMVALNPSFSEKQINIDRLRQIVWSKPIEQRKYLSTHWERVNYDVAYINCQKASNYKNITNEVSLIYYKQKRLQKLLNQMKVDRSQMKWNFMLQKYQNDFAVQMDKHSINLSSFEQAVWKVNEQTTKRTQQFVRIKDEILKTLISNKFYQEVAIKKFYQMSNSILLSQLELKTVLSEDLAEHQRYKYQKLVIKQTINTVLAPKVKLNPFISSPLRIDNYFFSGNLKLAYIDAFLNKMKNRAVMIELAQGGFGFLLKIAQLDQCVNSLCKSVIGFSEKEFQDRFRTFLQAYQQLKEDYQKSQKKVKHLQNCLTIVKDRFSAQPKSMLFKKCKDYIETFTERQKTSASLYKIIKGLQNKFAIKFEQQYRQQMQSLRNQNKNLKKQFAQYQERANLAFKNTFNESKEVLYHNFRHKVEGILNKNFLQQQVSLIGEQKSDVDQSAFKSEHNGVIHPRIQQKIQKEKKHIQIQEKDSELLLKKLQQQKVLYQFKINAIVNKYERKIQQLQSTITQQKKIQNTLYIQSQKNYVLSQQLERMQTSAINIQQLRKDKKAKEQQANIQKFRLIKNNQSLNGKIQRQEKKIAQLSMPHQKRQKSYTKSQVAVQADESSLRKRKSIRVKTQIFHSQTPKVDECSLWRNKWETSQMKYQDLKQKISKIADNFKFTKNYHKIAQNILRLIDNMPLQKPRSSLVKQRQSFYKI